MWRALALLPLLVLAACNQREPLPPGYHWDADWKPEAKLGAVTGLAFDSEGYLYAFHRAGRVWAGQEMPTDRIKADTIVKIDPETGETLASFGSNLFVMPHGLGIDQFDTLWAVDAGSHQMLQLTTEGEVLTEVGEFGVPGADDLHFGRPTDVAFLSNGEMVVADGYENARVAMLFGNGTYRDELGTAGFGWGEFNIVHGIAVAPNDRIYVADRENERVQLFNPAGNFLGIFDTVLTGKPYGLEVDQNNHLYIVSSRAPEDGGVRLIKLTGDAELLADYRIPQEAGTDILGHDVAVGPDGRVFIADAGKGSILRLTLHE